MTDHPMTDAQGFFHFASRVSFAHDNFLVTDANRHVFEWLEKFPQWPLWGASPSFLLVAAQQAGKTHCLHMVASAAGAHVLTIHQLESRRARDVSQPLIIDDVHHLQFNVRHEEALFHLMNEAHLCGRPLLFASAVPPQAWKGKIMPDLLSRLTALALLQLQMDDDVVLGMLLKILHERGLTLSHGVVRWLMTRLPSSPHEIKTFASRLEHYVTQNRTPITLPIVKEIVSDMGWHDA